MKKVPCFVVQNRETEIGGCIAGVRGEIVGVLGEWLEAKPGKATSKPTRFTLYEVNVNKLEPEWPEQHERTRFWVKRHHLSNKKPCRWINRKDKG